MARHPSHEHHVLEYRSPEAPTGWHEQDWLLIIDALERYAWEEEISEGQELRAYQIVESIARLHGTVSLGAAQRLDVEHFEQHAHDK